MRITNLLRSRFTVAGLALLVASCASPSGNAPNAPSFTAPLEAHAKSANHVSDTPDVQKERRGLATGWGKVVESRMTYTDFKRSTENAKYVTSIRYNDKEGAKLMGVNLSTKGDKMQRAAGGLVEWGMTSGWGSLESYWWRGSRFVVGKKGREYQLKVKNVSWERVEVVLSVDGLDVIDGMPATTSKRGYIIEPGKTLTVKGFRASHESVASFKFSTVSGSYTNLRHGESRNVGVIGLALFTEKGGRAEIKQRGGARAFADAPNVRARD